MAQKTLPSNASRPSASGDILKPTLFAGLVVSALAAIIWLAAVSLAQPQKSIIPEEAMEFMHSPVTYNDTGVFQPERMTAPDESRMPSTSHIASAETPRLTSGASRSSPRHVDTRKPGERVRFIKLPTARRNLLVSRSAEPTPSRQRIGESGDTVAGLPDGTQAALARTLHGDEPATPRPSSDSVGVRLPPPLIALALARAAIPEQPVVPDANAVSDSSGDAIQVQPTRSKPGVGNSVASTTALASPADAPALTVDDLFSLKLRGEYATSKATMANGDTFRDRFLVLGGKKKFEFAGMDQVDLEVDGVITTGGHWNTSSLEQSLSGITLNAGPEIKFPELPVKLDLNLGVGWLKREATGIRGGQDVRADIDSMVYGGGAALRSDWRWRMFSVTGLAGVQYATATDKGHSFKAADGSKVEEVQKITRSAWELPVQVRVGGEYKLLNALSVLPSLWGGYTHNITGKGGAFHNGHLAGAEATWRRHGMTWNRSSWNFGGELRIRAVDRFELWLSYQKEWAGNDSGSYTGGGLQIAF